MTEEVDGFPVLTERRELLIRQVHPNQVTDGIPQSAGYNPTEEHNYLLSTRREWVGPKRAYREHQAGDLDTDGSWCFSVGEAEDAELLAFDDSVEPDVPEGHVSVDFRGLSKGMRYKKAGRLRDAAQKRPLTLPGDGFPQPLD